MHISFKMAVSCFICLVVAVLFVERVFCTYYSIGGFASVYEVCLSCLFVFRRPLPPPTPAIPENRH